MKVGIIDYGGGNLRSLRRAVEKLGHEVTLIDSAKDFSAVTHILFPGQGAYGDCLKKLADRDLIEPIKQWIAKDLPFFGICVGYQLLFESSLEAKGEKGLEVVKGDVIKFSSTELKVPHMGWNNLIIKDSSHPIWKGLPTDAYFYFVHSYHPESAPTDWTMAECEYGVTFPAVIGKGNVIATQFHPEKSQHNGLQLIENFLECYS